MNIADVLRQHAKQSPLRIALIERRGSQHIELNYADFERQAQKTATLLQQRGLQQGDRVLLFLPMSIQLYVTLLACFRLGLVACFIDPGMGRAQLEQCCELANPKAFIATARGHWLRLVSKAIRAIPNRFHRSGWLPGSTSLGKGLRLHPSLEIVAAEHETALLTFTSGSTGTPKAAARSHHFLLAQHKALVRALDYKAGEMDFTTLPIFVLANLASGMTTLLPDGDLRQPAQVDAARLCEQLMKYQPQRLSLSPTFLQRLVDYCLSQKVQLSFPLHVFVGGGPVFPALLQRVHAIATRVTVTTVYGCSEAEPIAHINFDDMDQADLDAMTNGRGLLVGVPESGLQLQIANKSGNPNQPGEICVRGEHVLQGYISELDQPVPQADPETAPWHRTGDCGFLDEQGRLWLLGRCLARVRDQHGLIFPFSVECAVMSHAPVERAAFVGYEGQRYLFIEGQHLSERDIETIRYAMRWAKLDEVHHLEHIPVDPRHNAKVDYPALMKIVRKMAP